MINDTTYDSLLDMFIFETSQLTEQLEQIILTSEFESSFNQATINEIFRIMHTIKGSAAMMMFQNISNFAHSVEDLFYYLRENKPVQIDYSTLSDLILEGIDFIKTEVEKIKSGINSDEDATELIERQKIFLDEIKNNSSTNVVNEIELISTTYQMENGEAAINHFNDYKAILYFEIGCEMENIRAYGVVNNLKDYAEELYYQPEDLLDDVNVEHIRKEGFIIYIKTYMSYIDLQQLLQKTIFLKDLKIMQLDHENDIHFLSKQENKIETRKTDNKFISNEVPQEMKEVSVSRRENNPTMIQQSFISVNVAKLDKFLDLVGEMVIAEAMVINNPDLRGMELNNFQKASHQLSKISSEMKDLVMSIRMVPLAATFHKMHRIVRDMSKKLNKEVHLQILGEETEVDKNIIEHISDPLMHLIRNAVDHGIEHSYDREQLGKPRSGTITIEAKNTGNDVLIIIKDDGQGLSKEKILLKARENNLLYLQEENMSDKEIFNLILLPGFSTKENITEFSGRGVGMDVVTKNIESISGSLSLDSNPGKGTTITIKIPLTLAIIDAMTIKVGNAYYTVPTASIQESFRPTESNLITDIDGNEIIMIRGQCYPVIRLHKLYQIPTTIKQFIDGIFIMVQQEGKALCIFADELIGQQQVVVKSLPKYITNYKKIKGLSGCTLLGDGSISLILDVTAFMNR
ncbi:MAG: cheA2 [Herbinix sp.]|jgi:two-component system chemotaxis sensor kinase CheA|nr:cheA2 [Herbinix sp.]